MQWYAQVLVVESPRTSHNSTASRGVSLGVTVFGNSVSVDAVGNRVGVGVACALSGGSTLR